MSWRKHPAGDTLIEVIFAFAILSTIIGFAYTGAISARKNALLAQERTQASLLLQYQTQALQAYRNSLPWDNEGGFSTPNFIAGGGGTVAQTNAAIDTTSVFCIQPVDTGTPPEEETFFQMTQNTSPTQSCNTISTTLQAPTNGKKRVEIRFRPYTSPGDTNPTPTCSATALSECTTLEATVEINWQDSLLRDQQIKNTVLLTRAR